MVPKSKQWNAEVVLSESESADSSASEKQKSRANIGGSVKCCTV